MEGLHGLGLDQAAVVKMLSLDLGRGGGKGSSLSSKSSNSPNYALDIRDTAVVYVNDIEKDPAYAKWPGQLLELLRPVFPGMLRSIRRNMFHLVREATNYNES
jgi:UDP-glucose:glycoprotein glucosyltransferase